MAAHRPFATGIAPVTEYRFKPMPARKPKVIVTRKLPDAVETRLRELFDTELNLTDEPMNHEALIEAVGRAEVLVATANARGIIVTHTPGVLTEDTADMTMALILAAARRVVEGSAVIQSGDFHGWSPTWMMGRRIWGKRLGIVGMGRIGQAVARRAAAFGLQIHYHNRKRVSPRIEEELQATYWESLDQMLARMDVISVNCPHTPGTYH